MLSQENYDSEKEMCKILYRKQGGCSWGKCEHCAVPLLLEKLRTWNIYDNPEDINIIKTKFFQ